MKSSFLHPIFRLRSLPSSSSLSSSPHSSLLFLRYLSSSPSPFSSSFSPSSSSILNPRRGFGTTKASLVASSPSPPSRLSPSSSRPSSPSRLSPSSPSPASPPPAPVKKTKMQARFSQATLMRITRSILRSWKLKEALDIFRVVDISPQVTEKQGAILLDLVDLSLVKRYREYLFLLLEKIKGKTLLLSTYTSLMDSLAEGDHELLAIPGINFVAEHVTLDPAGFVDENARDYFVAMHKMLVLEKASELSEGIPMEWLKARGTIELKPNAASNANLQLELPLQMEGNRSYFGKADMLAMVAIHPETKQRTPVPLYGYVLESNGDRCSVRCYLPPTVTREKNLAWEFEVSLLVTGVTQPRTVAALLQLCQGKGPSNEIGQLILNPEGATEKSNHLRDCSDAEVAKTIRQLGTQLNESQIKAIKMASSKRVSLIHGPPGTGKTKTAAAIVAHWLRTMQGHQIGKSSSQSRWGKQVLVVSGSNKAADNVFMAMKKFNINAIRIGEHSSLAASLHHAARGALGNDYPEKRFQYVKGHLDEADVIVTTCAGALSSWLEKREFWHILVDEATQSTEPTTLIPLVWKCKQVVLIGDPKQLPPTVKSQEARKIGLSQSLFTKLSKNHDAFSSSSVLLDTQYRMHPAISAFPSNYFYQGLLRDGVDHKSRPNPKGFSWPKESSPLAFVHVIGVEEGEENPNGEEQIVASRCNMEEIGTVLEILRGLEVSRDIPLSKIGVITPYLNQAEKLKAVIDKQFVNSETGISDVLVSTVDGFQGMEKEVIIFSAVRSNKVGRIGFLGETQRMNVALTRARSGLIVVGNQHTLKHSKPWMEWLEFMEARGLLVDSKELFDVHAARNLISG